MNKLPKLRASFLRAALALALVCFSLQIQAQSGLSKQWDKTLGGSGWDELTSLEQTSDGGYILGGHSYSGISGDKSQDPMGDYDYWVVKLDAAGNKVWDKTFGGSSEEALCSLQQTSDGGYILGGYSTSGISGDKSQASQGGMDYWVVKLDAAGNKTWDKAFGGSNSEELFSLQQTSDGGYILGGSSNSNISGDKSQVNQGGMDYWVVKLDAAGSKTWDKTLGGSGWDELYSIQQTSDGGYILGGFSESSLGGDKSQASQGESDFWVVKLDAAGNKTWDKTLGGNRLDSFTDLQQTSDGGYILGGYSNSNISGDKSQVNQGIYDYWVVKLDAAGSKTWDKTFGGSGFDLLYSLQQTTDGGYILGGRSNSNISGDKSQASQGYSDYWVVKLDAAGNKTWDKAFGGNDNDELHSLQQTSDGGYILGGYSLSGISGDKSQANQGNRDYWVVKLDAEKLVWTGSVSSDWSIAGNWAGNIIPIATTVVTIPSGVSNFPKITSGTIDLQGITIASGATLTLNGGTFNISGSFTNNGVLSQTGGVLALNGNATNSGTATLIGGEVVFNAASGTQTVPALTYYKLTISGGGSKTLQGNATVNGVLNFTGGSLTTSAASTTLTLASSAILTETGASYFKGTLIREVNTSLYGFSNFNDLGVVIDNTGGGNWGTVTITRTNDAISNGSNHSIKRSWNISPATQAGTSVNVTFTWPTAEDNGLNFSNGKAQVWKSENSGTNWQPVGEIADVSNGTDVRSITATTHSFSFWTVSNQNNPLPVSWLYFKGKNTGARTELIWATATEKNSENFVVERSENGRAFETIGTVKAAGTSNQEFHYTFTDKAPVTAKTYYRLKQVDLDGKYTYSTIVTILKNSLSGALKASVYPNPFNDVLTLQTATMERIKIVALISIDGKEVYRKNIRTQSDMTLNDFPVLRSGLYLLQLIGENGIVMLKVSRQ
jgi:hypothetical protein